MGFLDSLFKTLNKAKEIVEDIQDKANNTYADKPAASTSSKTDAATEKTTSVPSFTPESISLPTPEGIASRNCNYTFFDGTEEADYEIDVCVSIDNRFHEYDSGAGEFNATYIYAPDYDENGDDILDWEKGTPYILVGFIQDAYNILEAYNKGKSLPSGSTLQKVDGNDKILYKTVHSKFNEKYVLYHFKRGVDHKLLYHIGAAVPENLVGTPLEKTILDAAELMVSTYTERIVKTTPVVK